MSSTQSLVSGEVYVEQHWPHGLACGQCLHVFNEPERYSERLYAFSGDQPLVEIVCLDCAMTTEEPPSRSAPPA
jgi:hypothetical protein